MRFSTRKQLDRARMKGKMSRIARRDLLVQHMNVSSNPQRTITIKLTQHRKSHHLIFLWGTTGCAQ